MFSQKGGSYIEKMKKLLMGAEFYWG